MQDAIVKQFPSINLKNKVLIAWKSLKMMPNKSINKYIEKFWDYYLKDIFLPKHFMGGAKAAALCRPAGQNK